MMTVVRLVPLLLVSGMVFISGGCASPVGTVVKLGTHLVGKVVDDEETRKLGQTLVGREVPAADDRFGARTDTLRDTNSNREWIVYPAGLKVVEKKQYVVEAADGRIVAVSMTEREGGETDIPRKLLLEAKVKGKSPQECESRLGMGPPLLTVRREASGLVSQIYDGRISDDLSRQKYCVLDFDQNRRCRRVTFIEVDASTKSAPVY